MAVDLTRSYGGHDAAIGRPVVYLDVDGVLNPWRSRGPHKHWPDYVKRSITVPGIDTYRLWISTGLADALVRLCTDRGIGIVWATSWARHIDLVERAYLIPAGYPVLPCAQTGASLHSTGKVDLVAADAGTRPVIWIDDCIGPDDRAWAADRPAAALLIRPNPTVGLRRADLDTINAWLPAT